MRAAAHTLTLVTAACILAACHTLFPHGSPEPDPPTDARTVDLRAREGLAHDRARELAVKDGPPDRQALPLDVAIGDKKLGDTKLAVDIKLGDLWPACTEVQSLNEKAAACGQQCTSASPSDSECDGLLDAKLDPQVGQCNRLLFSDSFRGPPSLTGNWVVSGAPAWTCGWLQLPPKTTIHVKSAAIAGAKTMVEVKLKLGSTSYQDWAVTVTVGDLAGCRFTCEIWVSNQYQPLGGLHFNRIGTGACSNTGDWTQGKSLATPAGAELLLRTWGDGAKQYCMLLSTAGDAAITYASLPFKQDGVAAQNKIAISTSGREVFLDHVRVFELK